MKLYRSNRVEVLSEVLADVLSREPADPAAQEVVVVHSRGLERWLSMQLAQHLGVCANVRFPFPGKIIHEALTAAFGDETASTEAWQPDRLAWAILSQLPDHLDKPSFDPLRAYLGQSSPGSVVTRKALVLARRVAEVLDRYITYRPELVTGWKEAGDSQDWQAQLFSAVRKAVGQPHVVERATALVAQLSTQPGALKAFPRRLCFFGISTLPPFYLDLLGALAEHCELHLFVLCPSKEYWGSIRGRREAARDLCRAVNLEEARQALHLDPGNPLLASLGHLGRDFQLALEGSDTATRYIEPRDDLFREPQTTRMLHVLQADILHLRHRGGRSAANDQEHFPWALPLDAADDSIQLHACHGPTRQVEVLRDVLLGLLSADSSLEPRDVVVMTPDLERYAPIFDAVLGSRAQQDGKIFPSIPFRIVDRSIASENIVARALGRLLGMVSSRFTATAVLDLLALGPVRSRFGIKAEDLPQIATWVRESGIRWGIDAAARERHGQPADGANTWRFGVDRMLVGHAMVQDGGRVFEGVLPYDEVEGTSSRLLGKFVEFCERLFEQAKALEHPRTAEQWADALEALLDAMTLCEESSAWLVQQVRDTISELAERAQSAGFERKLELDAVAAWLEEAFVASGRDGGLVSGAMTCCAMIPMRSIPFRVVCMVGMDDGAFPRQPMRLGFDILERQPRIGDRSQRDDDRYLFLEALLAARQKVIITYTGRSPKDNKTIAPAVPVGELLEVLERSFVATAPDGATATLVRQRVVKEHPLQPFSPYNFGFGADAEPLSFDQTYLEGARKLMGPRGPAPAFLSQPLSLPKGDVEQAVTVRDLVQFFQNPTRFLLTRRLGLWLEQREDALEDREPIELNALERFGVGNDLMRWQFEGLDGDTARRRAQLSGQLPLGAPGKLALADIGKQAAEIVGRVQPLHQGFARRVLIDTEIADTRLVGHIDGVWRGGLVHHAFSKIKRKHVLSLWIAHLALSCSGAPGELRSYLVGRGEDGPEVRLFAPLDRKHAEQVLQQLLELYWMSQRLPLLFFPETSHAWVEACQRWNDRSDVHAKALAAARRAWEGDPTRSPGESADSYLAKVFGGAQPFDQGFSFGGTSVPDGLDFRQVAQRVWGPVLEQRMEEP